MLSIGCDNENWHSRDVVCIHAGTRVPAKEHMVAPSLCTWFIVPSHPLFLELAAAYDGAMQYIHVFNKCIVLAITWGLGLLVYR
tara:strand:+ start:8045 stop:8296 length:252 start_codon:yes stop_codon:yes gene_type:complete